MSEGRSAAPDHSTDRNRRLGDFIASVSPLADSVADAPTNFAVDGCVPGSVAVARSADDVRRLLTEARHHGLAVIPWGSGSQMGYGNTPRRYDVALDLRALVGPIEHEPADLTVTVDAGVTLQAVQAQLAEHGQFLPISPPAGAEATVGGVLAANAQGPLRHRFGTARDWLIGIEVVQADGTLVKSGGRVVKNVAGYDMTKLYIGSLGTLGVVTRATFKVAPRPVADRTIRFACSSAHAAALVLLSAHDAGLALYAAELLSPRAAESVVGHAEWTALARAAGGAAAVERSVREIREIAGAVSSVVHDLDHRAWLAWDEVFAPAGVTMRVSVLPSHVPDVADTLAASLAEFVPSISATPAAGVIRIKLDVDEAADARSVQERSTEIADAHGGSLVIDAAPRRLKDVVDVFGPLRADFGIMRRLKEQLDTAGTLAPGRFVGRL